AAARGSGPTRRAPTRRRARARSRGTRPESSWGSRGPRRSRRERRRSRRRARRRSASRRSPNSARARGGVRAARRPPASYRRRPRDHSAVAGARTAGAREAEAELEREAASRQEEVPALEERARTVARQLPELPPEPAGPRELVEWASRARATLFVALSILDVQ